MYRHGFENPFPGIKIDFEGNNGSGKFEQFGRAHAFLAERVPDAVFTKEPWTRRPDGTPVLSGLEIYGIFNRRHPQGLTEASLGRERLQKEFLWPNRMEHFREVVIPALAAGRIVLSDRGPQSALFGAISRSSMDLLMHDQVRAFQEAQVPFIWADTVIIYDVPASVAMERMVRSGKALDDHENLERCEQVRARYHELFRTYPNCHLVDGTGTPDEVWEVTWTTILATLATD